MPKHWKVFLILLFFITLLGKETSTVKADRVAPDRDYSVSVGDNFVFVIFAIGDSSWNKDPVLRDKYPASGLYRIDDPENPIWTVDWYSPRVELSDDGRYLLRFGRWPGSYAQLAVAFYRGGQLLEEYMISELVAEPERLPHSVSHFSWVYASEIGGDFETLTIATYNKELYVFDMHTGKVIKKDLTKSKLIEHQYTNDGITYWIRISPYGFVNHHDYDLIKVSKGNDKLFPMYLGLDPLLNDQSGFPEGDYYFYPWMGFYELDETNNILIIKLTTRKYLTIYLETGELVLSESPPRELFQGSVGNLVGYLIIPLALIFSTAAIINRRQPPAI